MLKFLITKFREFYNSQDRIVFYFSLASIILALAIFISWIVLLKTLPPQVPLYYSLPWGERQLANKEQLFILPALIFLITLLNATLSWHLHTSQYFIKRLIASASLLFAVIITIALVKIFLIFI